VKKLVNVSAMTRDVTKEFLRGAMVLLLLLYCADLSFVVLQPCFRVGLSFSSFY
jgi:hypothetical protein